MERGRKECHGGRGGRGVCWLVCAFLTDFQGPTYLPRYLLSICAPPWLFDARVRGAASSSFLFRQVDCFGFASFGVLLSPAARGLWGGKRDGKKAVGGGRRVGWEEGQGKSGVLLFFYKSASFCLRGSCTLRSGLRASFTTYTAPLMWALMGFGHVTATVTIELHGLIDFACVCPSRGVGDRGRRW